MSKVTHEFDLYGKHYTLETGELAKQATGAVLVKQGDTTILMTAVVSKERKNYDFFPLTVDFVEKMYSVGRLPGGYLKRETRPTDKATLTARMIDRPIRPSFPDGFRNEVQIVATSLVCDQVNPFDVICTMGASAALTVGGVPFEGPLACVRIGRDVDTGEFIVNPTYEEQDNSDLDLELGGTRDFVSMLEAGAHEISEEDMLAAIEFGQEAIGAFCEQQKVFFEKVAAANGPIVLKEYPLDEPNAYVHDKVFAHYDEMSAALKDADKQSRMGKVAELKAAITAEFTPEEQLEFDRALPVELKSLEKHAMRCMVVETGERVDGRAADEIRPIMVKPGYLPLVHGSGLFQRGQTQVLSVLTLGMLNEWQRLDTIEPLDGKRYIHQYNFPPYCTSEGITAMQMDNKATGLTMDILRRALEQAKEGRAFILGKMLEQISGPREDVRENAPHIITIKIPADKIREVIGSGGKTIRGIQEDTGATIDIQEDGTVFIGACDSGAEEARARIEAIVKVPEVGEEYFGRVVGIQPFGAFVELLPGKDGLLHISRVAQGRVDKVEDVLNIGDEVHVKVIEVDEKGKVSLDRIDKPEVPGGGSAERGERHPGSGRSHADHAASDHGDRPAPRKPRRPGDHGANAASEGEAPRRTPRRHHEG